MEHTQVVAILQKQPNLTLLAEIMLQNEVGEVPRVLHMVIASSLPKNEKLRVVRAVIEAGADCDQRDGESYLTACEFTLERLNNCELVLEMIRAEVEGLPEGRAFYVMIRRGSLEVFKLFLNVMQLSDDKVFQNVANTMIELNTKRVVLNEKMQMYLQYLLANYAHENLCGDVKTKKDFNEWRLHFDVIEDNWKTLKQHYDDVNFANVDNRFLYAIQTIHNHLYFIRDKRFLKKCLPIMEITFCLAMFVSIFKWESEYEMFRLVINKLNIMQFLDVICCQLVNIRTEIDQFAEKMQKLLDSVSRDRIPSKKQLEENWNEIVKSKRLGENICNKIISGLKRKNDPKAIIDVIISTESLELSVEMNSRDRSTLCKLKRCYHRTRQLYSMQKCIDHIEAMSTLSGRSSAITAPAVKRLIQVIGEAIKSTKNTPNVPKRVEVLLEQLLGPGFAEYNKQFREFYSHKHSLAKQLLLQTEGKVLFAEIATGIRYVEMVFSMALIYSTSDAGLTLLGFMRRCQRGDQLATLLQYVSDFRNVEQAQVKRFARVLELFQEYNEIWSNAEARTDRSNLNNQDKISQSQREIIDQLHLHLISKWQFGFDSIKAACDGKVKLGTIYRMIEYNLASARQMRLYDDMRYKWLLSHIRTVAQFTEEDLHKSKVFVMHEMLFHLHRKLTLVNDEKYLQNTRQILEEFVSDPSQDQVKELHEQLMKYYENIFFLDNKYKAIKQFFKKQNLPLDEQRCNQMRRDDEIQLQQIFNSQVEEMHRVLLAHGIASVDDLITNVNQIHPSVIMALEHYQLELCEILITVGHYGDNFHMLKHRIPLIYGRNYRNYLAHDQLSYNVLTESSKKKKIVINAIAMVNHPVDLYAKKCLVTRRNFSFPTSETAQEWMMRQQSLGKSIQELNYSDIQKNLDQSADLRGRFCRTIGPLMSINTLSSSLSFVDPNSPGDTLQRVLKLFLAKLPQELSEILNPLYRSWYAVLQGNFERSFQIFATCLPVKNLTLPKHFFYWGNLITNLRDHCVDFDETDWMGRSVLHRLVQAGNYRGVEELLESKPNVEIKDAKGLTPLYYALKYGHHDLAKLLLLNNAKETIEDQLYAIRTHSNDLFPHLFKVVDTSKLIQRVYLVTIVKANNLNALEFFINQFYNGKYANLKEDHLSFFIALAAHLYRSTMVKLLLNLPYVAYFSNDHTRNGNHALQFAVRSRNWSIARCLLQSGASPHMIDPAITSPLRTAFHLAVNANRLPLVHQMGCVDLDPKLYQAMVHPLTLAIKNGSLKMVKYLQEIGFSLLDSNTILQTAIECKRDMIVEQVFQAIDRLVEEWSSEKGSIVNMVGNLLSRWKAIAYLEELELNSTTVLLKATHAENWDLLEELVGKCKKLRKIGGIYLNGIQIFCQQQLVYSNDRGDNPHYMQLFEHLLSHLKSVTRSDSSQLTLQLTEDRSIDVVLLNSTRSIKEAILNTNNIENFEDYSATLQDLLQVTDGLLCGTVYDESSTHSYFIITSKVSCLLTVDHEELQYPLRKMVNTGKACGKTPLHVIAAINCPLSAIELLLSNGANPLALSTLFDTPLHAVMTGQFQKAKLLLEALEDVSAFLEEPNSRGRRPIHIASGSGDLQTVQYLIDRGVDLRTKGQNGETVAEIALTASNRRILDLLLNRDRDLVHLENDDGQTLLHKSVTISDAEMIGTILKYSPDLTKETKEGLTAIELALLRGNATWLKTVLEYARANEAGSIPTGSAISKLGSSWFLCSALTNHRETMQIILEYVIDCELTEDMPVPGILKLRGQLLSQCTVDGFTALHVAVHKSHYESVAFILHCQNLYNHQSDQKLDLARQSFNLKGAAEEILEILHGPMSTEGPEGESELFKNLSAWYMDSPKGQQTPLQLATNQQIIDLLLKT